MKKLLTYIGVFIVITAFMFLFFSKNFQTDMAELCLNGVAKPEQVAKAMEEILIYDYLNIYDIFSYEENVSVYSGNINILLKKSDIEECGITFNDNEVIIGDRYMKKQFKYNVLGERYISSFGEYDVNCIIKNNDRVYYRDLNILQNTDVKSQKIYLSLISAKKLPINYNNTIDLLKYYGINVSKSIYYADVINFFQKLLILLIISGLVIVFIKLVAYTKNSAKQLLEFRYSSKYDLELREFIFKPNNIKLILKVFFEVLIQILIGFATLWLTIVFLNTQISYSIDFTSLKSVADAINAFARLIKYYIVNGFTDISLAIVNCIIIYSLTFFVILIVNATKHTIKIKAKKQNNIS